MSSHVTVTQFNFLEDTPVDVLMPVSRLERGKYMFTVDWYGSPYADGVGDLGHKCGHVIELSDGNITVQPNNRLCWRNKAYCDPFTDTVPPSIPLYRTNTTIWKVEDK